jgi:hypothetical protein
MAIRARLLALCLLVSLPHALSVGADRPAYDELSSWVQSQRSSSGSLPGPNDLADRIRAAGNQLSPAECTRLWCDWASSQSPSTPKDALLQAIKEKGASIESARFRHSISLEEMDQAGNFQPLSYRHRDFLMDRGRLKLDEKKGKSSAKTESSTVLAYDGKIVRRLYNDMPGGALRGTISTFQSRQTFFDVGDPLAVEMLCDSRSDLGAAQPTFDLRYCLDSNAALVLDAGETIDGHRAIMCARSTPPNVIVWLDPDRGFAVLKVQSNTIERDENNNVTAYYAQCIMQASDFQDCGNGVWMPRSMVRTWFGKDGKVTARMTVAVEDMAINCDVKDSEFSDIFPSGTYVTDAIGGSRYYVGKVADAERSLINMTDELKREVTSARANAPDTASVAESTASSAEHVPAAVSGKTGGSGLLVLLLAASVLTAVAIYLSAKAMRRERP